jgi:hypothetical protein
MTVKELVQLYTEMNRLNLVYSRAVMNGAKSSEYVSVCSRRLHRAWFNYKEAVRVYSGTDLLLHMALPTPTEAVVYKCTGILAPCGY